MAQWDTCESAILISDNELREKKPLRNTSKPTFKYTNKATHKCASNNELMEKKL